MCTVCGCSSEEHGASAPPQTIDFGQGPAGASLPGVSQTRTVTLERNILDANNRFAEQNRSHFKNHGVRALNLLSSPGSGKTTLLCKTLQQLKTITPTTRISVIEGDQQTSLDAERIHATGFPVVQVNTGKGCHLDARMVAEAFSKLHTHDHTHDLTRGHSQVSSIPLNSLTWHQVRDVDLLFIENVGNLVCPALWDLGEDAKVVILSVTEGEDKPLKYPDMFQKAHLLLINKIDLLPHVDFDPDRALAFARRINPGLACIRVSATTGEGMAAWIHWLLQRKPATETPKGDPEECI
jgi:hydrogenase nickel incorporation protein HypB